MIALGDYDDGLGRRASSTWWSMYPPSAFPEECRRTNLSQAEKVYCDRERRRQNQGLPSDGFGLGSVSSPIVATWWALGATGIAVAASVWMLTRG